jgi:hypothetical protein
MDSKSEGHTPEDSNENHTNIADPENTSLTETNNLPDDPSLPENEKANSDEASEQVEIDHNETYNPESENSTKRSEKIMKKGVKRRKKSVKHPKRKALKKDKTVGEVDDKENGGRKESSEWIKEHQKSELRTRLKQAILKLVVVGIVIILIISVSFIYLFYRAFDYDADGILNWDDDDDDNDGMPDKWEKLHNFEVLNPDDADLDADSDNLTNEKEYTQNTDPRNPDTDRDGLFDGAEIVHRTDPLNPDSDNDKLPDGWEVQYGLNPKDSEDAALDSDNDGLIMNLAGIDFYINYTNIQEFQNGTNPTKADTDGDSMYDGWELHYKNEIEKFRSNVKDYNYTFDPTDPSDGEEDIDVDFDYNIASDGLTNTEEFLYNTNPLKPDSDGDELIDGHEVKIFETDPNWYDSDSDLLSDGWEVQYNYDPLSIDSDGNSINDSHEDDDGDGLPNIQEYFFGTNPQSNDTDLDGMDDGWEIENNLDPKRSDHSEDFDNDSLINYLEKQFKTDPHDPDTDDDSLNDGAETLLGWPGMLISGVYTTEPGTPRYFSNPLSDDSDNDGLKDYDEIKVFLSNATDIDTDNDGLLDNEEIKDLGTNASKVDSDSDGLNDTEELNHIYGYITLPTVFDSDNDGLGDGEEIFTDFYPGIDFDATKFGCKDNTSCDGTDPTNYDTDGDGLPDGWEAEYGKTKDYDLIYRYGQVYGINLLQYADPDNDKIIDVEVWLINPLNEIDSAQDPDYDSYDTTDFSNLAEYGDYEDAYQKEGMFTDPLNWDSDKDGMSDGWEFRFGKDIITKTPDPMNASDKFLDPDNDGAKYYVGGIQYIDIFTNYEEYFWGTDPNDPDTDNDGTDYDEIWFDDHDNDGLYTGWEMIFNGSVIYAPNGYTPHFVGGQSKYYKQFDPFDNDSNDNGVLDGDEDPDGDEFNNSEEQGNDLTSSPGSSDPTDIQSVPGASMRGFERTDKKESLSVDKFKYPVKLIINLPESSASIKSPNRIYESQWMVFEKHRKIDISKTYFNQI